VNDQVRMPSAETMGGPEPAETKTDLMGGPEPAETETDLMRGPEPAETETDLMGGPGARTDVPRRPEEPVR
jgi:hypothetical protein